MEDTVRVKDVSVNNDKKKKSHYPTKQQLAYEIIRSKILDGTYKPLQHLRMIDLTDEIGVSSIPIREALKQLENEGLVKFHLNRGVQVASYSLEEFENLYIIRATLEGLAGRLGTNKIAETDINRMKTLLKQMDLALRNDDFKEKIQLNYEFHLVLYRAAKSQQLIKMITNLWDNTYHNVYVYMAPKFIPGYHERDQQEHDAIIDALIARAPERVERLLIDAISTTGKIMIECLKNTNGFFKTFDNG
jgi:DNA-binding GntR family transcriptional regulator